MKETGNHREREKRRNDEMWRKGWEYFERERERREKKDRSKR